MKKYRKINFMMSINWMFLLFISMTAHATKIPDFLIGSWKVEDKQKYEQWQSEGKNQLSGVVFKVVGGKKKVSEYLRIKAIKKNTYYSATVLDQNDGKAVDFKLKKRDKNTYSFENPAHDFPKKIIYQKVADDELFIQVLGDDEGFSYKMFRKTPPPTIPEWFVDDLKANIGSWVTDNSTYKSETEPYDQYGMEWKWGIGQSSIIGRLYGLIDGKEQGDFWQFRQYWDNEKKQAVVQQFGHSGVLGIGSLHWVESGVTKSVQSFSLPDGQQWLTKHVAKMVDGVLITTSFNHDENKKWKKDRSYKWTKKIPKKDQLD